MQKFFTSAEQNMTEHLCGLVTQQTLTFTGLCIIIPLGTIIVENLTHHSSFVVTLTKERGVLHEMPQVLTSLDQYITGYHVTGNVLHLCFS